MKKIGLIVAAILFLTGVYLVFFYNHDAYERQALEESLADEYIDYLVEYAKEIEEGLASESQSELDEGAESASASETDTESPAAVIQGVVGEDGVIYMERDYEDNTYYEYNGVTYTPDYAKGYLLCVLEYPALEIRRGVYSGTWDDIYENLDMWMVTIAHPDMELGKTHLSIYGHNHTSQNLSFNNLSNAKEGDVFYLYATSGVYAYEVESIFSDWRESTTEKYVEDFSIGADICYIITCGRDYFLIDGKSTRYKDFIVQGRLVEHLSLTEYAKEVLADY